MHTMHFLVFASYSTVAETSDVVLESDSSPYFQGLGLGLGLEPSGLRLRLSALYVAYDAVTYYFLH